MIDLSSEELEQLNGFLQKRINQIKHQQLMRPVYEATRLDVSATMGRTGELLAMARKTSENSQASLETSLANWAELAANEDARRSTHLEAQVLRTAAITAILNKVNAQ